MQWTRSTYPCTEWEHCMFTGLVLMLDFVRIVEASVSGTLCMRDQHLCVRHLFIVGLKMVQVLQGYGIDQKSHPFSRAITLAIPEKHAWGLAQ